MKEIKRYRAFGHVIGASSSDSSEYGEVMAYTAKEALRVARERAHKFNLIADKVKLIYRGTGE